MTIEHSKPGKPFRQGRIDSLCGLYAIINALTHARRDNPVDHFPNQRLFDALVDRAAKIGGSSGFVTAGLSYGIMEQLLAYSVL